MLVCSLMLASITQKSFAQNLVPNPSFEMYDTCPFTFGQTSYILYWFNPTFASPDYYNSCASSWVDIPSNSYGYENSHSGNAYSGFDCFGGENEYMEVQLTSPLIANYKYYVTFYVSLCDSVDYAISNIGAHFSVGSITDYTTQLDITYTPQVFNPVSNILTNKTGWTMIADTLVASGGEDHITIGNFLPDSTTANSYVGGPGWFAGAMYYLDDVSVVLSDSSAGIASSETETAISVYPNPSKNFFTVFCSDNRIWQEVTLILFNELGEEVKRSTYSNSQHQIINCEDLSSGVYFLRMSNSDFQTNKRIVLIK